MKHEIVADPLSRQALAEVVSGVLGVSARIRDVQEEAPGPQGASGDLVSSFTVRAESPDGALQTVKLISKEASARERRVLELFSTQRQAIPVTWVEDLDREGQARIFQEYAKDYPSPQRLQRRYGAALSRCAGPAWFGNRPCRFL